MVNYDNRITRILTTHLGHRKAKSLFGKAGSGSYIINPIRIIGGKRVTIGNNTSILNGARIETYGDDGIKVEIGDDVNIEQNVHITAMDKIIIENECSILGGVTITDIEHPYEDIEVAPGKQKMIANPVKIGSQSFIGMGARIFPGVTIGKHCVIGANAVVTHDIPDYCVAAGVPARVIKKYDPEKGAWVKV